MAKHHERVDDLVQDGFSLDSARGTDLTIAYLSLRSGLRAWFSAFRSFLGSFHMADPDFDLPLPAGTPGDPWVAKALIRQAGYPIAYFEYYGETIWHFQHFFELIIKDILRQEHELLASDASREPLLLWALLKKEAISAEDNQKLKSIEFSEALQRFTRLFDKGKLDNAKYQAIRDSTLILEKLNTLRNRLLHRGTFVMTYAALDEFVGTHVLPLALAVVSLAPYNTHDAYWKYSPLSCGIDPINELIKESQAADVNFKKLGLLKELGRAAYQNPVRRGKGFVISRTDRERAELVAKVEARQDKSNVYDVLKCPVCGSDSLVRYYDIDSEYPDAETPGATWLLTTAVQCFCCSFELNNDLANASVYNIAIEDYWIKEDLASAE